MLIHELTRKSNQNIDLVMKEYPHLLRYSFSNTYFMKLIYSLLCKAQDAITRTTIKHTTHARCSLETGPFLPTVIQTFIQSNVYHLYHIHVYVKDTLFEIKLYTIQPENIQMFVYFIRFVLVLCSNEVELKPSYQMTFILSPFEKKCQSSIQVLEPIHVNSGYNYKTEVVLFRKEELLKVFIHECFHLFCLDFKDVQLNFQQLLQPLFSVESDYLLFESLCEFWARTLNAAIFAFFMEKDTTFDDFERIFQLNLNIERIYSMIQLKHFLSKFGMRYEDLIEGTIKSYQENTNGICYYVITSVLLFHYQQTMNWFVENNATLLQFTKNTNHIMMFYHYIKSIYRADKFLKTIESIQNYDLDHLSMAAFDIELFKHSSQSGAKGTAED